LAVGQALEIDVYGRLQVTKSDVPFDLPRYPSASFKIRQYASIKSSKQKRKEFDKLYATMFLTQPTKKKEKNGLFRNDYSAC